jgi:hypothetical protein
MAESPSRIEQARGRLKTARIAFAATAVAAFAAFAVVARAAHPGTHTGSSSSSRAGVGTSDRSDDSFGFGDGSIGPSDGGGMPQISSGGS